MRKQGRAGDIVVPVDGITSPSNRDDRQIAVRPDRGIVKAVGIGKPFSSGRPLFTTRRTIAAIQYRTEMVCIDVLRRNAAKVGLNHLPYFLLKRHSAQKVSDSRFDNRVHCNRIFYPRPDCGIGRTTS